MLAKTPEKVNHRTIGRGSGGVLTKPGFQHKRDPNAVSASSIPSNFETVLFRNNREQKGFGSAATRFDVPPHEADDGPASFSVPGVVCSGSCGCRGHGGFASRVPRLTVLADGQAPGPGAYDAPEPLAEGVARGEAQSAAFALPGSVNPNRFYERPTPGAGHYHNDASSGTILASAMSALGVARGPRRGVSIPRETRTAIGKDLRPGPADYNSDLPPRGAPSVLRWRSAPTKHRRLVRGDVAGTANPVVEQRSEPPGPGDYSVPEGWTARGPRRDGSVASSCFRTGKSHLPRKWREPAPGPGQYDRTAASSPVAGFVAASPRFQEPKSGAPGPAHYDPKVVEASNFHLNLQQKWL